MNIVLYKANSLASHCKYYLKESKITWLLIGRKADFENDVLMLSDGWAPNILPLSLIVGSSFHFRMS